MVRRLVLVLMVLLVLVTAAAVVAWIYIDHLAAAALITSIEYLGEVECTVRDVSVSLLTGRIRIDGLVIRNPPGYASGELLTVERADLHVRLGSLWNQPVHVLRLEVAKPVVRVEAGRSGANVRVFLENVRRKIAVDPDDPPTRMWVDKLVIREASVRIGSGITGPDLANVALTGPVEMTEIRGPNGKGVTSGELAAMVLFEVSCRGDIAEDNVEPVVNYGAMGVMQGSLGDEVNIVSAPYLAAERRIRITSSATVGLEAGFANLVEISLTTDAGTVEAAGTLFAPHLPRIVRIDGFAVELDPVGDVLILRGNDVPGVIGKVGAILGAGGVNIARMTVGRRDVGGKTLLALNLDSACTPACIERFVALPEVDAAASVRL